MSEIRKMNAVILPLVSVFTGHEYLKEKGKASQVFQSKLSCATVLFEYVYTRLGISGYNWSPWLCELEAETRKSDTLKPFNDAR